jgi:type IX secretion system PorP/SprF family membrane protein
MVKRIIKYFWFLIVPLGLSGQQAPVSDQYILNPFTINPAYAGGRGALNFAAFYRRQWVGIEGAPETLTVTADAPVFSGKLGLGLIMVNDKIGVTKETSIKSVYSYKIKTGEGSLALGLGAGILGTNTAWSDLTVVDPGDEYYLIDSKVFVVPDFSFGLYFNYEDFFAGLSLPRMLEYTFDFDKNKYSLKVNPGEYYYLFNTGYVINVNPKTKFFPSGLVSFSPGKETLFDLNAHFSYIDRLWLGASYRSNNSVAGLFQFAVNNQLKIAYSYYFDFNKLGTYSNGTHEVMLRYEFRYQINAVNPLIF